MDEDGHRLEIQENLEVIRERLEVAVANVEAMGVGVSHIGSGKDMDAFTGILALLADVVGAMHQTNIAAEHAARSADSVTAALDGIAGRHVYFMDMADTCARLTDERDKLAVTIKTLQRDIRRKDAAIASYKALESE